MSLLVPLNAAFAKFLRPFAPYSVGSINIQLIVDVELGVKYYHQADAFAYRFFSYLTTFFSIVVLYLFVYFGDSLPYLLTYLIYLICLDYLVCINHFPNCIAESSTSDFAPQFDYDTINKPQFVFVFTSEYVSSRIKFISSSYLCILCSALYAIECFLRLLFLACSFVGFSCGFNVALFAHLFNKHSNLLEFAHAFCVADSVSSFSVATPATVVSPVEYGPFEPSPTTPPPSVANSEESEHSNCSRSSCNSRCSCHSKPSHIMFIRATRNVHGRVKSKKARKMFPYSRIGPFSMKRLKEKYGLTYSPDFSSYSLLSSDLSQDDLSVIDHHMSCLHQQGPNDPFSQRLLVRPTDEELLHTIRHFPTPIAGSPAYFMTEEERVTRLRQHHEFHANGTPLPPLPRDPSSVTYVACVDTMSTVSDLSDDELPPPCVKLSLFTTFMCFYTYVKDCIRDFFVNLILRLLGLQTVASSSRELYKDMRKRIQHFVSPNFKLSDSSIILFVEIKATIHTIHYCWLGRYQDALGHLSYFVGTRFNLIHKLLSNFDFNLFEKMRTLPLALSVTVEGVVYSVSPEQMEHILMMDEAGVKRFVTTLSPVNNIEPTAGGTNEYTEIFAALCPLIYQTTNVKLSPTEAREALTQLQLKTHQRNDTTGKINLLSKIITLLMRFVYQYDPSDPKHKAFTDKMCDIIDFVDKNFVFKSELSSHPKLLPEIITHYNTACSLNQDPRLPTCTAWLLQVYRKRFVDLESLYHVTIAVQRGVDFRQTPVCVMAVGKAGVGKTIITTAVAEGYCYAKGVKNDPSLRYVYNAQNEFHEGYNGQTIVIADEAGQATDPKERLSTGMFFLNAINSALYNMPRAFEAKGYCFFTSKLVLITTNMFDNGYDPTMWQMGVSPGALHRRMHLVIYRADPLKDHVDVATIVYTIQHCLLPKHIGKKVTVREILTIVHELEAHFAKEFQMGVYTPERLAELFPDHAPKTPADPVVSDKAASLLGWNLNLQTVRIGDIDTPVLVPTTSEPTMMPTKPIPLYKDLPAVNVEHYIVRLARIFYKEFVHGSPNAVDKISWIESYITSFYVLLAMSTIGGFYYYFYGSQTKAIEISTTADGAVLTSPNSKSSGHMGRRASARYNNTVMPKYTHVSAHSELYIDKVKMDDDSMYLRQLTNNISKCMVRVGFSSWEGDVLDVGGRCIGYHLCDGIFAIPAHAVYAFIGKKEVWMQLEWIGGGLEHQGLPINMQAMGDQDCIVFQLYNHNWPKSVINYIWTEASNFVLSPGLPMKLVTLTHDVCSHIRPLTKGTNCAPLTYEHLNKTFEVEYPINYPEYTTVGDSGALITVKGANGKPMIVGMHVAKETKGLETGFATPLTREAFVGLFEFAKFKLTAPPVLPVATSLEFKNPLPVERTVPIQKAFFPPLDSSLVKSDMYEWKQPAKFKPVSLRAFTDKQGNEFHPYMQALNKIKTEAVVTTPFSPLVIDWTKTQYPRKDGSRVYTLDEALNGVPEDNFKSISMATSAGYFAIENSGKGRGKDGFIEVVNGVYKCKPSFQVAMNLIILNLLSGIPFETLFTYLLKDEPRELEKVAVGKARGIASSSLEFTLVYRMYFGSFIAYVQSLHNVAPIALGIDPHSADWLRLYNALLQYPDGSLLCGDFTGLDLSMVPDRMNEFLDFVNWWYNDGEVNQNIRKLIFYHVLHPKIVVYTDICPVVMHMTGEPGTTPLNSLYVCWAIATVLWKYFDVHPSDTFMKVYGDDNIVKTKKSGLSIKLIAPHLWNDFGLKITHWSKKEEYEADTIENVRFLGRAFVFRSGICFAPLHEDIVYSIGNFYNKSAPHDEVMLNCADSFFNELSHFSREFYDQITDEFLSAVAQRMPQIYKAMKSKRKMYSHHLYNRYYNPNDLYIRDVIESCSDEVTSEVFYPGFAQATSRYFNTKEGDPTEWSNPRHRGSYFAKIGGDPRLQDEYLPAYITFLTRKRALHQALRAAFNVGMFQVEPFDDRGIMSNLYYNVWRDYHRNIVCNEHDEFYQPAVYYQPGMSMATSATNFSNDPMSDSRNSEFTDRAQNEPPVSQITQLGGVRNVGETLQAIPQGAPIPLVNSTINFPTYDASNSLNRQFNVDNPTVSSATGSGTIINSYAFPSVLTAYTYISEKMNDWRMFLAAVKFTVSVTSNREAYGKIMIYYVPYQTYYTNDTATLVTVTAPANLYEASGGPCWLLSVSAGSSVEIVMPFVNPNRALDLRKYGAAEMGRFYMRVLDPVTFADGVASSVTLNVYASFVDAKLFLPCDIDGLTFTERRLRIERTLCPSMFVVDESQKPYTERPKTRWEREKERLLEDDDIIACSDSSTAEGFRKSKAHSVSHTLDSVSSFASKLSAMPIVGGAATTISQAAGVGSRVAKMFGYDMPSTKDVNQLVAIDNDFGMNNGNGTTPFKNLGVDMNNEVSSGTGWGGVDRDEMDIQNFARTPTLCTQSTWLPGSTDLQIATTGVNTNVSYADYLKLTHLGWTGDTKVGVYITASKFHDVRMAFYLADQTGSDWKILYSQVVEIQGDTTFFCTIPFCLQGYASTLNVSQPVFSLYAHIVAWNQLSTTASTPVYVSTFIATDNMHIGGPLDKKYTVTCDIRADFEKPFPPIQQECTSFETHGIIYGEDIRSIRDLCHRMVPTLNSPSSTAVPIMPVTMVSTTKVMGVDFWTIFFRMWHGSAKFKAFTKLQGADFGAIVINRGSLTTTPVFQAVSVGSQTSRGPSCIVPFMDTVAWEPLGSTSLNSRTLTVYGATFLTKGYHDDMRLQWMKLPPAGTLSDTSAAEGIRGFASFVGG